MKKLLLLLFILITQITFSQEKISKEQIEMFYKFAFEMNKDIFKKKISNFRKEPLVLKEKFKTIKKSKSEIDNIIATFKKNATIKTENAGAKYGLNILLDTKFSYIDDALDLMKVEMNEKTTKLFDSVSKRIKIKNSSGATSFGEWQDYSNINGKETKKIYTTIHKQNQIFANIPIKGIVKYNIKFVTGYNTKTLTKDDIGESFILNKNEYKLIDIFNNKVVLERKEKNLNIDIELKMINISKDEKFEFIKESKGFFIGSSALRKDVYELFKNNKEITLKEYKEIFPVKDLLKKIKNNENISYDYLIFDGSAPTEKIILYVPIYIKQEIELKL